jgi:hypothetical protein
VGGSGSASGGPFLLWAHLHPSAARPIPPLAPLPLHRNAGEIADLNPDAARAGAVGAIDPLRYDALGAKPARVVEHGRPILGEVFVEQDTSLGIAQQACQRDLALKKRTTAQIIAIVLDQVKGMRIAARAPS